MSSSPSHTNGDGNDHSSPPLSPTSADDEPADYEGKLKQVLGSDEGQDDDEEEEGQDEFGDFLYHGKDAPDSDGQDEREGYAIRLHGVLGSTASCSDDDMSSAGTPKKPRAVNATPYSPQMPSTPVSPCSNVTFPAALTPSRSITDSLASAAFPRRPAAHPQISRLRSTSAQFNRFPSTSSTSTFFEQQRRPIHSLASSGFDLQSRTSSVSNIHDLPQGFDFLTPDPSSPAPTSSASGHLAETLKWSPLKRISSKIYPPHGKGATGGLIAGGAQTMGVPTVLAVSGIIAVGTSKGWVTVFDFGQNLRGVLGTDAIAKESGAVTALAISQDHTFVAVGHALGSIHLYTLVKPSQPARSVPPTTLPLVLTGRKEGHLVGSRILHLGFVGARHTAIVSSDETGLAFYHSLGKVLMLASVDIIRMLGRYPDSPSSSSRLPSDLPNGETTPKPKKPSTILDMAPLPLGPAPHSSDSHSLVALMTPTKLVIVGLKPTPRTWWRATFAKDASELNGADYSRNGVLAWYPSVVPVEGGGSIGATSGEEGEDPVLAFAWGRKVRWVRVGREAVEELKKGEKEGTKVLDVVFREVDGWTCDSPVLGLQWYSERVVFVLTAHHVDVYDIQTRKRIGRDAYNVLNVVAHDYCAGAFDGSRPQSEALSYAGSFRTHKRKLFLLTLSDLRAGAVLSWADRILGLMQPGTILEAIEVTTSYLLGHVDASTIALPDDPVARRELVEPKLREILAASLDFVFSEERLRDGSHNDGAQMQRLFEGLVGTCVRACLATGDVDWLFDDLYERYERNGIESIFLERIEPFVLSGSVHALPPSVSQRLIAIHEERGQYEAAQRIIWHVDPEYLDINQALGLCQRQKLYDALIYVYTRSMHDFIAPIVELLVLLRRIQQHRKQRPRRVGEGGEVESFLGAKIEEDVEVSVPDAYKVYAYLSQALSGLSYPSKDPLPYDEAVLARNSVYSFLFSGRTLVWPERGGQTVVTSDDEGSVEPPYPYLRLLLRFDAEAMLDALDLAFEDSYLEDDIPGKPLNRQLIVNLLLEVMGPDSDDFTPVDRTFLHIFVARNLPKYPQYIELRPSVLHRILIGLATDPDQSTTEDRQLAAEYLLSSYTPHDGGEMIVRFEHAGFFRILRSIYRGERRWAALASTYLRDPDVGADIFDFLRETLKLASRSNDAQRRELAETILVAVPSLVQADEAGLHSTADLIDTFLPSHHAEVISRLASTPWRQFAYLRCLLEPATIEADASSPVKDRAPTTQLDTSQQLLYLSLLCTHEPYHVIRYLESDPQHLTDESEALKICQKAEVFDALIWMMDRRGKTKEALDRVDDSLESRTDLLVQTLLGSIEEEDEGEEDGERRGNFVAGSAPADVILEQISAISKVAIQICVTRTSGAGRTTEMTGEDLWFRLLSSLVATVRAVRAICPAPPRTSDRSSSHRRVSGASILIHGEPQPLSDRASDTLSSLIPTALSSLVSTTSTREVSFPNLMRRLIDSNARSPAIDRSYAEFKAIVTSMLDTYVFEGDLLGITSKISAQDLFAHVERFKMERESGWRPGGKLCDECWQPVWGPEGQGSPPMSRSASVSMVVETLGMTGRPRMKKRPSLKGKEVEWPEGTRVEPLPVLEPPRGVVVGRDGKVWHQSCHLLRTHGGR